MPKKTTKAVLRNRTVFVALFAALISVSCFVAIPAGPLGIPIVMQNMMVVLAGTLLGAAVGSASVFLFLAAGALGLPVFSGGTGGYARFLGPTGGFLAGYFFGALVAGLILAMPKVREKRGAPCYVKTALAIIAGNAAIYALGLAWLAGTAMHSGADPTAALHSAVAAGLIPFIPGAIVKFVVSVPLTVALRPLVARYINPDA